MTERVVELDNILVVAAGKPVLGISRFTVSNGETVALVGPNGAGKTTLLHIAALLRQPDRGTVTIHGQRATPANAARLRRALSIVFQDPLLFAVSVQENAATGARFQHVPRAEADRRARFWLDRFGVSHLARRKVGNLSGGEAQRVALARAFVTEPSLLLLDEPFSTLDAPTRGTLLPELRTRLHESGAAAILVTHDLDEAISFATTIALMDGGRIIASGDPQALLTRPPSRRAAELLGVETIVAAHIMRREGDALLLLIEPNGPTLRTLVPPGSALTPAACVTVTLPVSGVRILTSRESVPDDWNVVPGCVVSATPQRTGTRIVAETPAHIAVHVPWHSATDRWSPGDPIVIAFPPAAAHVIGGDGPEAPAALVEQVP